MNFASARTANKENSWSPIVILSYVLGIGGLLLPFIFGPIALILGVVAYRQRARFALGALIIGIICTIWGVVFLILGLTYDGPSS